MSKHAAVSGKHAALKPTNPEPNLVPAIAIPEHNGHGSNGDAIRLAAYLKWEAAGKPECDGTAFWLEAEHESQFAH